MLTSENTSCNAASCRPSSRPLTSCLYTLPSEPKHCMILGRLTPPAVLNSAAHRLPEPSRLGGEKPSTVTSGSSSDRVASTSRVSTGAIEGSPRRCMRSYSCLPGVVLYLVVISIFTSLSSDGALSLPAVATDLVVATSTQAICRYSMKR
eukprot:scaffold6711_cov118-Isochrysis_galbana.AAC.11